MTISREVFESLQLICPACRGEVVLKEDGSQIKCTACRRVYPTDDGIPGMRVEEATFEDEEPATAT